MKQGWQSKPFEECIENVKYTIKIPRKDFLTEGAHPIISQENGQINGYWDNADDLFIVDRPVVIFGDHTQILKFVEHDFVLGADGVKILKPKNFLDPRFFYYAITAQPSATLGYARHYRVLKEKTIHYPPLHEQQRIVAVLDEAFAGIATATENAKKNLQNARELFESHLQSIFTTQGDGWVDAQLEDMVDASCSLSYGIVQPGEEYSDGLPIVRPTDLVFKFVTLSGLKRINPALASAYKRTVLVGGELLLCVRGSTGVVSVASKELAGGNVTRGIVPIRFKSSTIQPEFGYYLFTSRYIQDQIKAGTYGAALMQINIRDIRKILLTFPPLPEQQRIVAQLDALSAETKRLEVLYQQKLELLAELKQSLLQKAFAGELLTDRLAA
jgi:type I restriction enzyme S subunit